jgi:hypothetical protein
MEFTFHNSYVILELMPSTVIFWTEFRCWHKSYSKSSLLSLSFALTRPSLSLSMCRSRYDVDLVISVAYFIKQRKHELHTILTWRRQLIFQWVPTMSLFAQTCSFIRMNLISCWASKKAWSYKCTIHYIDDVLGDIYISTLYKGAPGMLLHINYQYTT